MSNPKREYILNNEVLQLGSSVTVYGKLKKDYSKEPENTPVSYRGFFRGWSEEKFKQPVLGLFIGVRSLQEGYTVMNYEKGPYFVPTNRISAALIVTDLHKNPFYVSWSQIKIPLARRLYHNGV